MPVLKGKEVSSGLKDVRYGLSYFPMKAEDTPWSVGSDVTSLRFASSALREAK
jgi:hypothetical protein